MQNRLGFIGGSDAIKIMLGNWHELWLEKTGKKEPEDLSKNIAVQLGIHTESFNVKWFCEEHNVVVLQQQTYTMDFDGVPYKGTVDGVLQTGDAILECKHTHAFNDINKQLIRYMPQLQFYMFVSNTKHCYFSNIFGNNKYECKMVTRDNSYIKKMNQRIKIFWDAVINKEEPTDAIIPKEKINIDKIPIDKMVARDATNDNHFNHVAYDYINTIESAKLHDNCKKDLKAMIKSNERRVYCDILSIDRDKRGALRFTTHQSKEN